MSKAGRRCSVLLSFAFFVPLAHAFSFAYGPPTQCDPFSVSWTGGTAPFSLLLTPVFDNPRNFFIPASAVNGSSGSYTLQLPLSAGQQFIVAMSDVTGFGTGGVSDILTVGSSVSRASCSTQLPTPSFQFELNSQLQQCAPYNISGYTAAQQPVTITGLIPLGKPLQLHPDHGPPWFVWDQANVPAGTNIVFFVTDAAGNFGGSSHVNQVGGSSNNGCINDQSPMSTANSASGGPTATGGGSPSTGAPAATVTVSPSGASPAVIGGAVAGGIVALLVLGTLSAFFFRTYRPWSRNGPDRASRRFSSGSRHQGHVPSVDLLQPNSANPLNGPLPSQYGTQDALPSQWTTFPATPGNDYLARPYIFPPSAPSATGEYFPSTAATENGWHDSRSDIAPPSMPAEPSAVQPRRGSKSSLGPPSRRPTRFVLHTDAEEEEIELPPQYTDRNASSHPHSPPS